jgi:hypothetical protein
VHSDSSIDEMLVALDHKYPETRFSLAKSVNEISELQKE